jgi:hypothetical protein
VKAKQLPNIARFFGVFALLVASTVAPSTVAAGGSPNPNQQSVPTTAQLGGGQGANMIIECFWVLPDMTPNDNVVTYGAPHDDTPSQDATLADGATTTGAACDPAQGAAGPPDARRHLMGMQPNADDNPIKRQYEKWVAVESTAVGNIADVYFKVWEPFRPTAPLGPTCGPNALFGNTSTSPEDLPGPGGDPARYCFKYQHHATANRLPPTSSNPLVDVTCANLQANSAMFTAARETGQMTQAEQNAMIDRCFQAEKRIFRIQEDVSKEQSCGEYRLEVTIVNSAGNTFRRTGFFDVLCFIHLTKDFTTIDWGTIQNGVDNVLSGDLIFGTADKPTVRNVGNDALYIDAHFDPAILQSDPTKRITRFDLKFRAEWRDPSEITVVPVIMASEWYCFADQPLGSNMNGKLDVSIHPENAQAGTYIGELDLVARTTCNGLVSPGPRGA